MGARSFAFCGSVGACAVTRLLNSRANNAVPNSIFFMAIIFVARRARLTGQLQSHGVAPDVAHADDHCCWNALSRDSERTSSQSVVHSGSRQVPLALSRCARKPILTLSRVDRRLRCGLLGSLLPSRQQEIGHEIALSGRSEEHTVALQSLRPIVC